MEKENQGFNPNDWEKCISTEKGEKAQCDRCKNIIESKKVGEHIFCTHCHKYIWRKKFKKEAQKDGS